MSPMRCLPSLGIGFSTIGLDLTHVRGLSNCAVAKEPPSNKEGGTVVEGTPKRTYELRLLKANSKKYVASNRLPGHQKLGHAAFALAQRQAQRLAFRQRKAVLRMDDWLEEALSFTGPATV
jgi:hypothetical protein